MQLPVPFLRSTVVYIGLSPGPGEPGGQPCQKGTLSSIAKTPPAVTSRHHARTGGQRKMSGRLFGYARVSVASDTDANNLETQHRVLMVDRPIAGVAAFLNSRTRTVAWANRARIVQGRVNTVTGGTDGRRSEVRRH